VLLSLARCFMRITVAAPDIERFVKPYLSGAALSEDSPMLPLKLSHAASAHRQGRGANDFPQDAVLRAREIRKSSRGQ
jgi:hypothetical protein